jgi:DNA-binding transcriptional LysR family regulator
MAQPTVARRVDALEHDLKLTLFERNTRGYHLTPEGTAMLPFAEAVQEAAASMEEAAQNELQRTAAPIRFTTWDDALSAALAETFADFTAGNPGTTFEFLASDQPLDLLAGEADVALRTTSDPQDDNLICRRIGATNWTYYASPAYAKERGLPAGMEDLDSHQVILLDHIPSRRQGVRFCKSAAELIMLVRSGQGIGPIPVVQGDVEAGLVRCFPPPDSSRLDIFLLVNPAAYRRPEVRRFVSFAAPRFSTFFGVPDTQP